MLDAIRAEALKFRRHRATWLMVWIYPIGIALLFVGALAHGAFAPAPPRPPHPADEWVRSSAALWRIPASGPGRFLIAGFTALMFAGEYGWNTWKLIIPARARPQLIAAKWVVALGFTLAALVAADLIGQLGDRLRSFQGDPIPAGVTLAAVAHAHLSAAGYALAPIVFTIAVAGLFAVATRSVLAALILSIAIVVLEGLLLPIGLLAHGYAPALTTALVEALPLYHLTNIAAWATGAGAVLPLGPGALVSFSWGASVAILLAWIAAAGAATQLVFLRQDLN